MLDLYRIGIRIYPSAPHRLFIYQLGDGFIVCPDFGDPNLNRPISIAIALMQSTALRGGLAKAAISHGEISDILSCYPKEIQDNVSHGGVALGSGIVSVANIVKGYLLTMTLSHDWWPYHVAPAGSGT